MIEHINTINALSEQISSLLDLMQMCEDSVDIRSIKTASEMCQTMHTELMAEVEKIEDEWQQSQVVLCQDLAQNKMRSSANTKAKEDDRK